MDGIASSACKRAVEVYGAETQTIMYFEEAGELAQAISKHKRGIGSVGNIAEEIADVEIMLEQLKYIYKCHNAVEHKKASKIVRLESRINAKTIARGKK